MTTPSILAGTTVHIASAAPENLTRTAYEALAFVPLRGVRVVGQLAKQYQMVPFYALGTRVPYQRRVARLPQSVRLDLYKLTDPGQALLCEALDQRGRCSFRFDVSGLGAYYFVARPSARVLPLGDATALVVLSVVLELESEVLEPT
ncbi:hypothetical protein C0J09_06670 [Bordetella avium]|uniref:hypothetical protein n=1 Tax=Bordetella avium TaxID=521 RepID=UPI000FD8C868|nr:hypothetical protein [Bordetella avium]AZY48856.1 hypothetical protein C0J09_06670 [Bordetella avium]